MTFMQMCLKSWMQVPTKESHYLHSITCYYNRVSSLWLFGSQQILSYVYCILQKGGGENSLLLTAGERNLTALMKLFGLMQLLNVALYFLVKSNTFVSNMSSIFYIIALVCWLIGAFSLNHSWEQGNVSHRNLMILTNASLFFAASMPYQHGSQLNHKKRFQTAMFGSASFYLVACHLFS